MSAHPYSAQITPKTFVSELAITHAGASRVFHRLGIDFCCNGRVSLGTACDAAGLETQSVIDEIRAEVKASDTLFTRWDERNASDLVEHLIDNFHEAHRVEMPRLIQMAQKVERVHGDKTNCPVGLTSHLTAMTNELEDHMQKEELVLFPLILSGRGHAAAVPIQVLEAEHKDHGNHLIRLRQLSHNYEPPQEACGTWRALYLGLAELEKDLMQHIHLENNVLFTKTLCEPRSS